MILRLVAAVSVLVVTCTCITLIAQDRLVENQVVPAATQTPTPRPELAHTQFVRREWARSEYADALVRCWWAHVDPDHIPAFAAARARYEAGEFKVACRILRTIENDDLPTSHWKDFTPQQRADMARSYIAMRDFLGPDPPCGAPKQQQQAQKLDPQVEAVLKAEVEYQQKPTGMMDIPHRLTSEQKLLLRERRKQEWARQREAAPWAADRDPEVERWVKLYKEGLHQGPGSALTREQRLLYSERIYEESQNPAEYARRRAKRDAIEASGGLNADEFAEFCALQYRRNEHWNEETRLSAAEERRLIHLYSRATRAQVKTARCQHVGTTFVLTDEQKTNPVLVAIADAFTSTDPIPAKRKVTESPPFENEYAIIAYHAQLYDVEMTEDFFKPIYTPLPFERHGDGTYTITIIFRASITPRDYEDHAIWSGGRREQWRWDGKTLTCETVERWRPKNGWGGIYH